MLARKLLQMPSNLPALSFSTLRKHTCLPTVANSSESSESL